MCILTVVLLLTFVSDGLCQSNSYLYYSDYGAHAVYRLDLDTGERITLPITGLISPLSVDYDPTTGHLYIANVQLHTDEVTKFFLKYHLATGKTETYYIPRSYLISAMALDPASQLIYYAERSAQVIIALSMDFKYETVIVNEILNKPSSLVLDFEKRQLYWADWSKAHPEIGKANQDGTKQERLVTSQLLEPYPIALDTKDKRLYWADNSANRTLIETSKTDGSQRHTLKHLKEGDFVMSIAIDEHYVYWILSKEGIIHRAQKYNFNRTVTLGKQYPFNSTDFRSLRLVKKNPPPIDTNACSSPDRGGCQHICVPTSQSRVCRCAEAYALQPDGRSCKEVSFTRGFITTDVNRKILMVHDLKTGVTKRLTDRWHEHENPLDVVFDNATKEVFWQDRYRKGIFKTCLPEPCYKQVRQYREKESQMTAMTVDMGKRMIYISDYGLKKLSKLSYSGTLEEVVVTNLTGYVTSMALDTNRGKVYWANVRRSIEVADMDKGTNRKVLLSMAGVYVSGMEVDSQAGQLYILDYTNNHLQAYDLNKNSKTVTLYQAEGTESLYGLTMADGILYFSDREKQSILEFDVSTNQTTERGRRSYKRVVGIAYFNLGDTRKPPDVYQQGPVISAVTDRGAFSLTLIIAIGVGFGGLIIIVIIISCAVVAYKRRSTTVEPEAGPPPAAPTDPPVPLDMMASGMQPQPPLGVYAELFCEPDEDEPKKQPLPPPYDGPTDCPADSPTDNTQPVQPVQPPPYERY